ncbi:MAG: hypothetical protein FWG61_08565 [Firmicutes bacterium]|nr:hypothetical protein [Bacillota bacterium]
MSDRIHISYGDVYSNAAALRSQITSEIDNMEAEYNQIQTMLDGVDGASNAALKNAMEANKEKTRISAMTLDKLLSFMDNSSKQVETTEQKIKGVFETISNFFKGSGKGSSKTSKSSGGKI